MPVKKQELPKCPWCDKPMDRSTQKLFMLAFDRPYRNVRFHRKCFAELLTECGGWDNLEAFIISNFNSILV